MSIVAIFLSLLVLSTPIKDAAAPAKPAPKKTKRNVYSPHSRVFGKREGVEL